MVDTNLKDKIVKLITEDSNTFDHSINILHEYKIAGGDQETAYQTLAEARADFIKSRDEKKEDMVLELMDIISGWCSSAFKIWEGDLKL